MERVRAVRSAYCPPVRRPSRSAPQHRLFALQRVVGNRAVAAALGHRALQRQIAVRTESGIDSYTWDEARDFRRALMLELKRSGYRDIGTKGMWDWVDEALRTKDTMPFDSWDRLIGRLVEMGRLDAPLRSGVRVGPKQLGMRPTWSPDTAARIRERRKSATGLAARHVIASSTLGLAIERSTATVEQMKSWLTEQRQTPPKEAHEVRRAIWDVVHNHAGNLWMGSAPANTAIGFIRGPLESIKAAVQKGGGDLVDLADVQELVRKVMVAGQDNERNRTWNLILNDLSAEIGALQGSGTPVAVAREDVVDLIEMYVRNADIDLPTLGGDEYHKIVGVWEKLKKPDQVLGALTDFMNLYLAGSIRPAR